MTKTPEAPSTETLIALMQKDIGYISKSMDEIKGDVKELKGAYLPLSQYANDMENIYKRFLTKEQFRPYQVILGILGTGFIALVYQFITNLIISK